MANTLINPAWVLMKTSVRLNNNLRFGGNIDRSYSDEFKQGGAKMGNTVKARLPQRYQRVRGAQFQRQDVTDRTVDIELTDQVHVGIGFGSWERTLNIERYQERYIEPAKDELSNGYDFDGMDRMYKTVATTVGTPAVVPGSTGTLPQAATQTYLDASERLTNIGVTEEDRRIVVSPAMQNYLINGTITLMNPAMKIGMQYKTGQFAGEALGWSKWFVGQNVALHTVGPLGGTPLMNTPSTLTANGATSLVTDGWTASAANRLKAGDVIQIEGVYEINLMNRQQLSYLKDFVVTSDIASDGSGNATITISPPLIFSGQFQNCSAQPADGAAITIFGHASSHANKLTRQALGFRKEAFAGVTADLNKPGGVEVSERVSNEKLAISMRMVSDYDLKEDETNCRLDMIYGFSAVRPEMAVRIAS
jgi:hypothetical protein